MEFTNTPPKWDATGAEPSVDLQTKGFVAGYKPPAAYFNYLFHMYTECVKELQNCIANIDKTYFKTILKADSTEAFFAEFMRLINEQLTSTQTAQCSGTHDGKDYYFGIAYKNGSTVWGEFWGTLNKAGYFVTYNANTGAVTLRNIPNENFSALATNTKANLVSAINEIHNELGKELLYGNYEADTISDYLKQVCTFVCTKESGAYVYRGAWTGKNYYIGVFYRAGSFVYGTVTDHNGKQYYCNYTPDSDTFIYKDLTIGSLANLGTKDKTSVVAAINELAAQPVGVPIVTATSTDGETYTANVDGVTELYDGLKIVLLLDRTTSSLYPTLNVNGLGAFKLSILSTVNNAAAVPPTMATWISAMRPVEVTFHQMRSTVTGNVTDRRWVVDWRRPSATTLYGQVPVQSGGWYKNSETTDEDLAEARESLDVYSKAEVDSLLGDINAVLETLIG